MDVFIIICFFGFNEIFKEKNGYSNGRGNEYKWFI